MGVSMGVEQFLLIALTVAVVIVVATVLVMARVK